MDAITSLSEAHGIELLSNQDTQIYSVGISTGGAAEIRMAQTQADRHIIATTIDIEGLEFARKNVAINNLEGQIDVKYENVAEPLPYGNDFFDYIYARLVLHYLSNDQLRAALAELYRILKPGGKLFVVVRSITTHDAHREGSSIDPRSMLTTYSYLHQGSGEIRTLHRYFHSNESIRTYVTGAGFVVQSVENYVEQIYTDFMRTEIASLPDHLIELIATKST